MTFYYIEHYPAKDRFRKYFTQSNVLVQFDSWHVNDIGRLIAS